MTKREGFQDQDDPEGNMTDQPMTKREHITERAMAFLEGCGDSEIQHAMGELLGLSPPEKIVDFKRRFADALMPHPSREPSAEHWVALGGKQGYAIVMDRCGINFRRMGYPYDEDGSATLWAKKEDLHVDSEEGGLVYSLELGADDLVYLRDHLLILFPLDPLAIEIAHHLQTQPGEGASGEVTVEVETDFPIRPEVYRVVETNKPPSLWRDVLFCFAGGAAVLGGMLLVGQIRF